MKTVKSEKGMILVTVLVVIIIFSVIGLFLLNFTVSNAKQTSNIETDMQSVDAAEMGIMRYRSELMLKVNHVLTTDIMAAVKAIEDANKEIAKSNNANEQLIPITNEVVLNKMVSLGMFDDSKKFHLGYKSQDKFKITKDSRYYYRIEEQPFLKTSPNFPKIIEINIISYGISLEDENKIQGSIQFDLSEIIKNNVTTVIPQKPTSKDLVSKPVLPLFENPNSVGTKTCSDGSIKDECIYDGNKSNIDIDLNEVDSFIKGNVGFSKNDIILSNSNLSVGGTLTFNTVNQISDTHIHAEGTLKFSNSNNGGFLKSQLSTNSHLIFDNMNKFDDTKAYAKGNITFGQINGSNGLKNSIVYAETGNITFQNVNAGLKQSQVFAGDNITFEQFNSKSGLDDSIMYIKGNFYVKNNIDGEIKNNSRVWVDGNIEVGTVNVIVPVDASSFVCAKGTISKSLKDKAINGNIQQNVTSYEQCGAIKQPITNGEATLKPVLPNIEEAINKAQYKYD